MNKLESPEQSPGIAEKLGVAALFAGIIAVGAAFFKNVFTLSAKRKEK